VTPAIPVARSRSGRCAVEAHAFGAVVTDRSPFRRPAGGTSRGRRFERGGRAASLKRTVDKDRPVDRSILPARPFRTISGIGKTRALFRYESPAIFLGDALRRAVPRRGRGGAGSRTCGGDGKRNWRRPARARAARRVRLLRAAARESLVRGGRLASPGRRRHCSGGRRTCSAGLCPGRRDRRDGEQRSLSDGTVAAPLDEIRAFCDAADALDLAGRREGRHYGVKFARPDPDRHPFGGVRGGPRPRKPSPPRSGVARERDDGPRHADAATHESRCRRVRIALVRAGVSAVPRRRQPRRRSRPRAITRLTRGYERRGISLGL
jgi:hypothetical protein